MNEGLGKTSYLGFNMKSCCGKPAISLFPAFRARVWISLSILLAGIICAAPCGAERVSGIVPFDPTLYETGYRIFLMNRNTADALSLAEAALRERPDDRVWRRRAAQCAEWSGKPDRALEHWSWLAFKGGDSEAGARVMELARGLNDLDAERRMLRHRLEQRVDPETLATFVKRSEQLGELDDAIRLLKTVKGEAFREFTLEQLSRLNEQKGETDEAIRLMKERAESYPLSLQSLLHLADLQYGRGDIRGAYLTLKGAAGSKGGDTKEYLEALSDLCWTMQDTDCSRRASGELIAKDGGRQQDYQRFVFSLRSEEREKAFVVAKDAWERFRKPWFFADLAELGESLGKWDELDAVIEETSPGEEAMVALGAYFWLLRSRVKLHLGRFEEALASYREAMRLKPGDEETAAGYIWLLLDLKESGELKRVSSSMREKWRGSPGVIDAMAAACAYLGENREALILYRLRYPEKKGDSRWLSAYADILDRNGRQGEAFSARVRAIRLVESGMKKPGLTPSEREELRQRLAGLLLGVKKGEMLDSLMHRIIASATDETGRELVAAWAISTRGGDFARWWLARAYADERMWPVWVRFGLALEENDREKLAAILETDLDRIPYRDAVEGARRAGAVPLAEQIAWDNSLDNPDDDLLHGQLRELVMANPSFARYRLRFLDRGGIGAVENGIDLSLPLTGRFTLLTNISHTQNTALRSGVVANIPAGDIRGSASLSYRFEKGSALLSAGWRSAVEDLPMFGAALSYRLSRSLEGSVDLEFSRPADESVPLIIAGARDRAALTLSWAPTGRDTLQGAFAQTWLRDQSRYYLGEGRQYTLDVAHRLLVDYPDISLHAFGGRRSFEADGSVQGKTLSLIPAGAPKDATYFVPASYWQVGAGVSAGQGYRDGYTREWLLFGGADFSWKSDTGFGCAVELGAHGPIAGNDSLGFTFSLDRGSLAASDLNIVIGTEYRYFF